MDVAGKKLNGRENPLATVEMRKIRPPQSGTVFGFCLFVAAYFIAYYLAMFFTRTPGVPFWLPDSVLLCALLVAPPRVWWIFILALIPIRFWVPVHAHFPLWFNLTTLTIDSVKGMLVAAMLRRFIKNPLRMQTTRDYAIYCLVAVLLVPAINAIPGGWARHYFGFSFWEAWEQWFLGNALAHLVVTPALLFLASGSSRERRQFSESEQAELGVLAVGLIVAGWMAFQGTSVLAGFDDASFYALIVFLFWAAVRFGMFGASGAIAITSFIAIGTAISGQGLFAGQSPDATALVLQHYLILRALPVYLVAVLVEQKNQAEVETKKQREELALVSRISSLGQMASALAHEIRQPLCAILRNAEAGELILKQKEPDYDEVRSILSDIRANDERAGAVIEHMRALLKRRQMEISPLYVQMLLQQVLILMRPEMMIRRITLLVDVPVDLPPILGDRVHLQQVLINLLMNGADAMKNAPAERRRIEMSSSIAGNGFVEVAVRDAGHGIPKEKMDQLFQPFFTTKSNGMGIGLAISKTIIESHGGRIWAENNPESGATVRFTLKVA